MEKVRLFATRFKWRWRQRHPSCVAVSPVATCVEQERRCALQCSKNSCGETLLDQVFKFLCYKLRTILGSFYLDQVFKFPCYILRTILGSFYLQKRVNRNGTLVADACIVAPRIYTAKRTSIGGTLHLVLFVCLLLFSESSDSTSENEMAKTLFNRLLSGYVQYLVLFCYQTYVL